VPRYAIAALRLIALGGAALWAWIFVQRLFFREVDPVEPLTGFRLAARIAFSLAFSASLLVAGLGFDPRRFLPLLLLVLAGGLAICVWPLATLPLTRALGAFALYFAALGVPALAAGWLLLRDRRERRTRRMIDGGQVVG
jgi:hypothetical protein